MPGPNEKLAQSLRELQAVQRDGVVRAAALSRTHRERLIKAGFLEEVVKGWLRFSTPGAPDRSGTTWYASFWTFLGQYLAQRFGDDYCLSPESSLLRHVESPTIPRQVIVLAKRRITQTVPLPLATSILIYHPTSDFPQSRVHQDGLWLAGLPLTLCRIPPNLFLTAQTDVTVALGMIRDLSPLLRQLLEKNQSVVAGRLAGAYEALGNHTFADEITGTMQAAGYKVRRVNPFAGPIAPQSRRLGIGSPAATRVRALWAAMALQIESLLPPPPGLPASPEAFLTQVEERYVADAYNSLSIEGYRVTEELIERVRSGIWRPDDSAADKADADALAARGYYLAFQQVKESLRLILAGANPAEAVARDHRTWYRELFAPAVAAGLVSAVQLAGYRSIPVYIRGSRHVPPRWEAVPDCLEALFELMEVEEHPGVRAVLGHFFFGYIHPYSDGNGRIGRFIMNALLAAGGYPWTIIRESNRETYLAALEAASTAGDLRPFATFVCGEMAQDGR